MPMTVEEFAKLYPNVRDVVLAERFNVSKDVIYRTGKALRDAGIIKDKKRGRPISKLSKDNTSNIEQNIIKKTKETLEEIEKRLRPGCQTKQLTLGSTTSALGIKTKTCSVLTPTNEEIEISILENDTYNILKDTFLEDVIRAIVQSEMEKCAQ